MTTNRSISARLTVLCEDLTTLSTETNLKIETPMMKQYKIQEEFTPIMKSIKETILDYKTGKLTQSPEEMETKLRESFVQLEALIIKWKHAVSDFNNSKPLLKLTLAKLKDIAPEMEALMKLVSTADEKKTYGIAAKSFKMHLERLTVAERAYNAQVLVTAKTSAIFAQLKVECHAIFDANKVKPETYQRRF